MLEAKKLELIQEKVGQAGSNLMTITDELRLTPRKLQKMPGNAEMLKALENVI